jgi:outer membrane porin, OprD family
MNLCRRSAQTLFSVVIGLAVAAGTIMPSVTAAQPPPGPAQPAAPVQPGAPPQDSAARPEDPGQRADVSIGTPDTALFPPQTGLLETAFPRLREGMSTLPPFIRDTDLNVRFRTFYFNRQSDDDTASEAWAAGGWIQYASGWLFDTFAMGATYYTSQPLYTPDTRLGTLLLTPDHDAIGVFGEAWGALRYKEYALLKGYRQRIDDGYVNSQDNRMVPNTFQAVTLSGKFDWLRYNLGYVWDIKPRDSNDFISMSRQAGAARGSDEGLILTSLSATPIKDLLLYGGNFYGQETFNTVFGKGEYSHAFTPDLKLQVGVQFTDQRSVGDELLNDFTTWNVGAGARVLWRGLSVGVATHFTSDEAAIRSPWGSWPGYLSLQVTDFNRANEKAFGVGVKYDFGGTLLPFQVPGLSVHLLYGQGNDRIDPTTDRHQPNTHEGNLDIVYNVPAAKGLSLRFRNAYVGRGNSAVLKEFRLIINYELDLL